MAEGEPLKHRRPRLVVFTTLFPHAGQPSAGLFIRERMFRVGRELPLVVVAPVPWFPFQGLIRYWRPDFRRPAPRREIQEGIEIYCPRFFSVPGVFKNLDGFFMALGSLALLRRLRRRFDFDVIDAHFAYPDGYAASLLGRWLGVPITITLRGTEVPMAKSTAKRQRMLLALDRAARVFSVSDSLKRHVVSLGADLTKIIVIGNGVDAEKFSPMDRTAARQALGLQTNAKVLISVGGLVERKGFHRVMACLPELRKRFPDLVYLVVGGASREGNWGGRLRELAGDLGLDDCVRFLGTLTAEQLRVPLSASDVFVLATRNEGWANVFLEAMGCGLPVVTTDVGGNREVVSEEALGTVVAYGSHEALCRAVASALVKDWDRGAIIAHARSNSWGGRVKVLKEEFEHLYQTVHQDRSAAGSTPAGLEGKRP